MDRSYKRLFFVISSYFYFFWLSIASTQQLPTGLVYSTIISNDWASIHLLEIDPERFDIIAAKASDESLETVLDIAKHHHAIAGINGGFFLMDGDLPHLPSGILKIENEWHSTPHKPRGAIGWSNSGQPVLFDQLLTSITARLGDRTLIIDGINQIRKDNQIILYNRFFQRSTYTKSGIEYVIKNHQIFEIKQGNTPIPADGLVMSLGPLKIPVVPFIRKGTPFSLSIQVVSQSNPPYTNTEDWANATYIVGGAPILIRSGQILKDFSLEQTRTSFLYNAHARTAVGLLSNGHWIFVVVDGRHFGMRQGMTIPALADFMKQIGCVDALNLDGGGSSIMVLRDHIVSNPAGEEKDEQGYKIRKVSDAILVIPKLK